MYIDFIIPDSDSEKLKIVLTQSKILCNQDRSESLMRQPCCHIYPKSLFPPTAPSPEWYKVIDDDDPPQPYHHIAQQPPQMEPDISPQLPVTPSLTNLYECPLSLLPPPSRFRQPPYPQWDLWLLQYFHPH